MLQCVRQISKFLLIIILVVSFHHNTNAQQRVMIPKTAFRSPLGIPLYLSGTFGEPREGHFHSGIDIKTNGVQGLKVYAVASGYVSRIKVSTGGYGKAIYITHPNGYVSVYGHLMRYNWRIQKFVKDIQYKRKSFQVEIFPPKGTLPVQKGEVIAFTGNTGSSQAPHLHFELRKAKSEHPVNPLLFKGINIKDHLSPKIYRLAVYPSGEYSCVNGKSDTLVYYVSGKGKHCYIKGNPVIKVSGPFSLGLQASDIADNVHNHNGIYRIQLYQDDTLIYGLKMKEISFNTTRYVNSLIDYHYYVKKHKKLYRTERDPNNKVMNYYNPKSDGVFQLNDTRVHVFKYRVYDIYGNYSILQFRLQLVNGKNCKKKKSVSDGFQIAVGQTVKIDTGALQLNFLPNTFYRTVILSLKKYPKNKRSYTPVFGFGNRFVPVQRFFKLSIKPNNISDSLRSKLYIAYAENNKENSFNYAGGQWTNDDRLLTRLRSLGYYTVMADTISPRIKPVNISSKTVMKKKHPIIIEIADNETGVKKYVPMLNQHWILMEYNTKTKRLIYYPDEYLKKGKNEFQLIVTDWVGNKKIFKSSITVQ